MPSLTDAEQLPLMFSDVPRKLLRYLSLGLNLINSPMLS